MKDFLCSFVYASPHGSKRRELWRVLTNFSESTTGPWILMGDFNCILDSSERSEGALVSKLGCKWFIDFLFVNVLRDLGAIGAKFTWYRGGLSQWLDRALCNLELLSFTPNCYVRNLHRLKLDYRPVLIQLQTRSYRGDRPFRCLASWFCHEDFRNIVHSSWGNDLTTVEKLD